MENEKQCDSKESIDQPVLTTDNLSQVSGGHSHARSSVFMARRPIGGLSSCKCELCGVQLSDAGAYYEHKRMVHGE